MKILPEDFGKLKPNYDEPSPANNLWDPDLLIRVPAYDDDDSSRGGVFTCSDLYTKLLATSWLQPSLVHA